MPKKLWTPPAWLPFVILLAAAVCVWIFSSGPPGPLILLVSGSFVCASLEAVLAISRISFTNPEYAAKFEPGVAERISAATVDIVRLIGTALAASFAFATVVGMHSPLGVHPAFSIVVLAAVGGALGIGLARMKACARDIQAEGKTRGLEGWNGITYSNPSNPRIWVPKIGGIGYTLNFAHRRSWLVLGLLLLPLLSVAVLGLLWSWH
jgi:hypothetical protein